MTMLGFIIPESKVRAASEGDSDLAIRPSLQVSLRGVLTVKTS